NLTYTIELFTNVTCDASGFGEGENLVASFTVTTDGSGNVAFSRSVSLMPGQFVTATATDPSGNTSEFSACATVIQGGFVGGTVYDAATGSGIPAAHVQIFTSAGATVTTITADGGGMYAASLLPGFYRAKGAATNF